MKVSRAGEMDSRLFEQPTPLARRCAAQAHSTHSRHGQEFFVISRAMAATPVNLIYRLPPKN